MKTPVRVPKNENSFYGMRNNLKLFQEAGKGLFHPKLLDAAWEETLINGKPDKEKAEMFYSLLFSIGDITARKHNILKHVPNLDNGGSAMRENFRIIMKWMREKQPLQYYKFMHARLFNEYTVFDNLLAARVVTKKKTKHVVNIIDMLGSDSDITKLAEYIATIIKGKNPFDKHLVSKFLTRPRLSKRSGRRPLQPATIALMKKKEKLIQQVSEFCDFPYEIKKSYINFSGYYNWRKQYNSDLESVLFSSGKIAEFDQEQFTKWLDRLPSTARKRVKRRVLIDKTIPNPKWGDIGSWYLGWENFKLVKQHEQRNLEEKVRQGDKSEETITKLQEVKKEAKVTTGAVNFEKMFGEIVRGEVDETIIQPFLDKINLNFNNLVFVDDSGSMQATRSSEYGFSALEFAAFMATISLLKNPDDEGRSMLGLFSRTARIFRSINVISESVNSIMKGSMIPVRKPLVNPEESFTENLQNITGLIRANSTYNGTYISGIPMALHSWTNHDAEKIELLRQFPVWTIVTDGNFNNLSSPEGSMNEFMYMCEQYFGFKPYIVAIDVGYKSASAEKFAGLENFMYLPANPAQVQQFLTNFRDMDVMDVYTPLQGLHRSNRYEIVRNFVL